MPTLARVILESPVGPLAVAGYDEKITSLNVVADAGPTPAAAADAPFAAAAAAQLAEYFAGERTQFDLAVDLTRAGTPFEQAVWRELQRIPYGETITYAELARRIGKPNACRAVGRANGRNPIWLVVPCHRVIGSNGALTGYAGGVELKRRLLDLEQSRSE